MKLTAKLISFLISMSSIFLLSACGVPTSKTTLKVTNSMAVGNSTYKGGLVFYGRSAGGKFFSIPIPYNSGAGNNTAEIVLDKGVWTFAAVGWVSDPGETNPIQIQKKSLRGVSECAVTTSNINTDNMTIVLDLNESNCTHNEFGGNYDTNNNKFKLTDVVTCGTFYTDLSTNPKTQLTSYNLTYCSTDTNITPDLKVWANSARIKIPAIRPGMAPLPNSQVSSCLENLSQGRSSLTEALAFRLPAKGVPVVVELFGSADCSSDLQAAFELRDGVDQTYSSFDHKYFTDGASGISALYFLNTISKRGTSSLMDSVPKFSCGDMDGDSIVEPCILNPVAPNNIDRVINKNQEFYVGRVTQVVKCSQFSQTSPVLYGALGSTPSNQLASNLYSCRENNGKVLFKITSPTICSPSCAIKFTFTHTPLNGTSVTNYINLEIMEQGLNSLEAYNTILGFTGHEDLKSSSQSGTLLAGINSLQTFYNSKDDEDNHFGILSGVRQLFQPAAIGGLFNDFSTANSILGKARNISLWEDGTQKSVRIEVESDDSNLPDYLRSDYDPLPPPLAAGVNHPKFTHKITVSKILGGAFYPETIIRFVYGQPIGSLEQKDIEIEDGNQTTSRSLIFWNTFSENNGRFEVYNYENEIDSDDEVVSTKTSFIRAERESTMYEGNTRLENYSFESEEDSSGGYNERAWKNGSILKNANASYFNSNIEVKVDEPYKLFSMKQFDPYLTSKSLLPQSSTAISPNKTYLVESWADNNGTKWVIKILLRTNHATPVIYSYVTDTSSTNLKPVPKVTINNGGQATVAFVEFDGTNYKLQAISWDGSSWIDLLAGATSNLTNYSGALASLTSRHSSTYNIAFDLIDQNPDSSTSNKHLIFSKYSSSWSIEKTTFSSGSWSMPDLYKSNLAHQPILLNISSGPSSTYHISVILNDSDFKIQTFKSTNFGTPTSSSLLIIGIDSSENPVSLSSFYNTTTLKTDIVITDSIGKIYSTEFDPANTSLTSLASDPDLKESPGNIYCFQRIRTLPRGVLNASATSNCTIPTTSYAPAIRNTVLIDDDNSNSTPLIDAGFKHDIKSLNPETFKYLFTIP